MSAELGFFLLFAGYVLYQYSVVVGWLSTSSSGYFAGVAIFFSILGLIHIASRISVRGVSVPFIEMLFYTYLLYLTIFSIISGIFISGQTHGSVAFYEALGTILIWIAVYFVGANLRPVVQDISFFYVAQIVLLLGCFANAMFHQGFPLGPFITFSSLSENGAEGATYQGIGRAILVMTILLVSYFKRFTLQFAIIMSGLLILTTLGSRSHLFALASLLVLHFCLTGLRRLKLYQTVLCFCLIVAFGFLTKDFFLDTRAAEIFDLAESSSWRARQDILETSLRIVSDSPIFGDFGYHLRESAGYAHNLLSAWTEFGILGILFFLALMISAVCVSGYRVIISQKHHGIWLFAFHINVVALFLAITTEPIFASVFPALGWGLTVQGMKMEQTQSLTNGDLILCVVSVE